MLSILIPVYNFDVTALVQALRRQALSSGAPFEIICLDDGSSAPFKAINRPCAALEGVVFEYLEKNAGRSRVRNLLAERARFENLLFMDCDSKVISGRFVADYLAAVDGKSVVCGGRIHPAPAPGEASLLLRWRYGVAREQRRAAERARRPHDCFMTHNFLTPKAVYLSIKLNERLSGYGHEDSLFGFALKQKGVPVVHIDNPLEHLGLESADAFLRKTAEGTRNLAFLLKENLIPPGQVRLLSFFEKIRRAGLQAAAEGLLGLFQKSILKNLKGRHPSLLLFDLHKLYLLLRETGGRKRPSIA